MMGLSVGFVTGRNSNMCGWDGNGWMWNGHYGSGWSWGGWILMAVVAVLFFAVLITAIVVAIRYLSGGGHGHAGPGAARTPEDALAERFARGEIDEDEYRRRATLLREHR